MFLNFGHLKGNQNYSELPDAQWFTGPDPAPSPGLVRIASSMKLLALVTASTIWKPRARKAVIAAE
jgi:hypothetical protein